MHCKTPDYSFYTAVSVADGDLLPVFSKEPYWSENAIQPHTATGVCRLCSGAAATGLAGTRPHEDVIWFGLRRTTARSKVTLPILPRVCFF